jgi:pimeloyl-ACP methyl ester carboxylesterase
LVVFGGADGPEVLDRARDAMGSIEGVRRWVVGGHSRGGAVAARFVHTDPSGVAGLVLIGTSHPRDFSLAQTPVPVTRVHGTRDPPGRDRRA